MIANAPDTARVIRPEGVENPCLSGAGAEALPEGEGSLVVVGRLCRATHLPARVAENREGMACPSTFPASW